MNKFPRSHIALNIFICLIPPSLVAGAAIMEIFIFLSCIIFFYLNSKNIGNDYYDSYFFKIFISFCGVLILSSLLSENILNSLRSTLFYFRFGVMTLIILYLLENYKKFKSLFFFSILVTLILIILFTFYQLIIFNKNELYRISGLFGDESVQGSYLLRMTPILIIMYLYNRKISNIYEKLFIFFLYLIFAVIIFSGERAAIFLSLISIILSFIFLRLTFKKIFLILLPIVILISLIFVVHPTAKSRIIDKTLYDLNTEIDITGTKLSKNLNIISTGHQQHFHSAIIMFKNYPLLGVGVRNFRNECKKDTYKVVGPYHCSTHPHNTYLQILSETGIIGFSFFIFFIAFVLFNLGKLFKKKNLNYPLCIALISILINFFPVATNGSFFNNWLSTLYFLPIAFLINEIKSKV